uniref:Uncharacterized protein n=1 Tax=Arundo donax TaxID=35708 RepID=A0A0A9AWI5_ARUDO
MKLQCKTVHFL